MTEENKTDIQPDWISDLDKQNETAFQMMRGKFNKLSAGKKPRTAPDQSAIARMMARGKRKTSAHPSPENE